LWDTSNGLSRREYLYRGRILALAIEDGRWEVVEHQDAVAVVALLEGRLLMVEQYRVAVGRTTLELPAGLVEEGEDPLQAARRELMEEAGYDAELSPVLSFYSSPGFTDELIHLFSARNLTPRARPQDPDERVERRWVDPRWAIAALYSGELVTSGPTVAGLLWLEARL